MFVTYFTEYEHDETKPERAFKSTVHFMLFYPHFHYNYDYKLNFTS
jgi:hypothetical protein